MMLLYVGVGGALGAMSRYVMAGYIARFAGVNFPYGTICINVLGSFLMGVLIEVLARINVPVSQEIRAFFAVGVLGGFTTFSSFSLDALTLYQAGRLGEAGLYVVTSVLFSLAGIIAGLLVVRNIV
ncbi:MAG: crcB [Rickettsiales bacterium]|jgi:CrcB protein|nr:crcB [Rickettsiales bacterium]